MPHVQTLLMHLIETQTSHPCKEQRWTLLDQARTPQLCLMIWTVRGQHCANGYSEIEDGLSGIGSEVAPLIWHQLHLHTDLLLLLCLPRCIAASFSIKSSVAE